MSTPGRLLAVDPSLTCSGWALFSISTGDLLSVGKIRSLKPSFAMGERLLDIQIKVQSVLKDLRISARDVVVCEAQTTLLDPKGAFKVEQVRGIFESLARNAGAKVPGRINPRSVQREVMGLKGRQIARASVKKIALDIAHALYGKYLDNIGMSRHDLTSNQDIVDAVLVGRLGLVRIQSAEAAGMSLDDFFAIKKVSRGKRLTR